MLPLLAGALALESIDAAIIVNILRYGLMTLGASFVAHELKKESKEKKKDVFTSKPQTDVLEQKEEKKEASATAGASSGGSSSASSSSEGSYEGSYSDGESSYSGSSSYSVSGSNLLDILQSSGQATVGALGDVAGSIQGLREDVRAGFKSLTDVLQGQSQNREAVNEGQTDVYAEQLIQSLQGIGAILGGIGLSLAKLTNVFTTPVSVNPEEHITTASNPVEMIAKASGIQAKTFADINSFDADVDVPDLPSGIDISQIFKFLRVSSQLGG